MGWPVPNDLLTGPVAVAFGLDNMPGVAKAVLDFTTNKEREDRIQVTGGIMTGEILNAKRVEMISKLPTLDEIRAQLAGLIVAPATGLVSVINAANGQMSTSSRRISTPEAQPHKGLSLHINRNTI